LEIQLSSVVCVENNLYAGVSPDGGPNSLRFYDFSSNTLSTEAILNPNYKIVDMHYENTETGGITENKLWILDKNCTLYFFDNPYFNGVLVSDTEYDLKIHGMKDVRGVTFINTEDSAKIYISEGGELTHNVISPVFFRSIRIFDSP
jgi:hypothetical protein